MTDQPRGGPWGGQRRVPPPQAATAQLPAVPTTHRSRWTRLTPARRALLIITAAVALPLFLCFGGLTVAAMTDDSPPDAAAPAPAEGEAKPKKAKKAPIRKTVTEGGAKPKAAAKKAAKPKAAKAKKSEE